MTTEREALKLAFEAFQYVVTPSGGTRAYVWDSSEARLVADAYRALEKALAPPEQAPTDELHSCPYAEEIHGNYEKVCDCDEERTRQCAQDI